MVSYGEIRQHDTFFTKNFWVEVTTKYTNRTYFELLYGEHTFFLHRKFLKRILVLKNI